jgi:hypothetical protein
VGDYDLVVKLQGGALLESVKATLLEEEAPRATQLVSDGK